MAESSGQASQRRANWIGLRTLRQHPKYVGETTSGDPVYEVRGVQLTLRPDGSHFHLLTQCTRCGRDLAGTQVFTVADLDHPSNPVICTNCVRQSGVSAYHPPETVRSPSPVETDAGSVEDQPPEPTSSAAPATRLDDSRLSVTEAQIQSLMGQVRELAEVVRAESLERRRAAEETRAQLQQVAEQRAGDVPGDAGAADDIRRSIGAIVEAIRGQRAEIADLAAGLTGAQQEIRRLADTGARLASEQGDLRAHVAAVEAPGAGPEPVTEDVIVALVEPRLQQVHASLGASVEARLAEVESTVADGLAQARFEAASLQERLDAAVVTLTNPVESQAGPADSVRVDQLAQLQADMRAALDRLASRAEEEQATLRNVVAAQADRLGALEERTELALNRLAQAVEARSRATRPAPVAEGEGPGTAASGLLDDFERQLEEAAGRLAMRGRGGRAAGSNGGDPTSVSRPSGGSA